MINQVSRYNSVSRFFSICQKNTITLNLHLTKVLISRSVNLSINIYGEINNNLVFVKL